MPITKLPRNKQKILMALLWCLKPSDLSILRSAIHTSEVSNIATTKHSANFILYSMLQLWGLAKLLPAEKSNISAEEQKQLDDTVRVFMLNQEAKPILRKAMKKVLSGRCQSDHFIFTKEAADILKIYEATGDKEAKAKLVEIYTHRLEEIAEEQKRSKNQIRRNSVFSFFTKPEHLYLCAWLAKISMLFFWYLFTLLIPVAIYGGDMFLLIIAIFFSVLFGGILWRIKSDSRINCNN